MFQQLQNVTAQIADTIAAKEHIKTKFYTKLCNVLLLNLSVLIESLYVTNLYKNCYRFLCTK